MLHTNNSFFKDNSKQIHPDIWRGTVKYGAWKIRHDGEVWFEKGWKEFAEYYSLGEGHLYLFKYEKRWKRLTSQFKVHIFHGFKLGIRPTYVTARCVAIPKEFAKKYLKEGPILLKVPSGRTWLVKFKIWRASNRTSYKFQHGWSKFRRENNLDVGDVCNFVLTNSTNMSFTVLISRAVENPSCSESKERSTNLQNLHQHVQTKDKISVIPDAAEDGTARTNSPEAIFNSLNTVLGPSLPSEICSDLDGFASRGELPIESIVLLKKFLVSHVDMQLGVHQFPVMLRQFVYSCVAELIKMLKSLPIRDLQLKHRDSICGYLETLRCCSFSNAWLYEVDTCFNLPLTGVNPPALQALTDLEDHFSQSNDILRRKISSLSSRLNFLKHELEVGEANL